MRLSQSQFLFITVSIFIWLGKAKLVDVNRDSYQISLEEIKKENK